jgi:two-component system, response regulator
VSDTSILLVEDNPDDALLARRALARCGFGSGLVVAETGEEALELLAGRESAAGLRPALVLLDLKLPGIDGIEVLRRIRADAKTRTLPVVVLSSSRTQQDVTACYETGANGFVQKDVDFDRFQEAMGVLTAFWLRVNVSPIPLS